MRTIIIYESTHHGNTRKLVDVIVSEYGVEAVSIENAGGVDLKEYDMIGLAAGIAFAKFYKKTEEYAKKLPSGKKVFLLFTCGSYSESYTRSISATIVGRGCTLAGAYGCPGFDTFGPFGLVGGIAKGHPTDEEIRGAADFFGRIKGSD